MAVRTLQLQIVPLNKIAYLRHADDELRGNELPARCTGQIESCGGIRFRAHLSLIVTDASDTSSADRSPTTAIVVSRASWDYCANGGWVFKV